MTKTVRVLLTDDYRGLRLLAEGLTNRQIALSLEIKKRTVGFHVSNVLEKLNVASRVEAAMWAKDEGIIS